MDLKLLARLVATHSGEIVQDGWVAHTQAVGEKVEKYRRYLDGDHDANMTKEMRQSLRIKEGGEFNANYMPLIVSNMADRLIVNSITTDSEAGDEWVAEILEDVRFDGLQMDVHDNAIGDGLTYVMVWWDNDTQSVKFTNELAYDGIEGVVTFRKSSDKRKVYAAAKIWIESVESYADTTRINIYYEDSIAKYRVSGGNISPVEDDALVDGMIPWTMKTGEGIGVAIVPFLNRERRGDGLSEIDGVIALQDLHNRTNHSLAMTTELNGFPIRVVIGTDAPTQLTPGMIVELFPKNPDGTAVKPNQQTIEWLKSIQFTQFDSADLQQFLNVKHDIVNDIAVTTSTPDPSMMSEDISGESRKQAEVGLLSKVRRAQVKFGNAWEDVMRLAWRVQSAFGQSAVEISRFSTQWEGAEVRNDKEIAEIINILRDDLPREYRIRPLMRVLGIKEGDIDDIINQVETDNLGALNNALFGNANGFSDSGQLTLEPSVNGGNGNG